MNAHRAVQNIIRAQTNKSRSELVKFQVTVEGVEPTFVGYAKLQLSDVNTMELFEHTDSAEPFIYIMWEKVVAVSVLG